MPEKLYDYAVFALYEERKGNRKYRRFFGIDIVNVPEITRFHRVHEGWPSIALLDLISLFPKMKPYERNESSPVIIVEYGNTFIGIVVPNIHCIITTDKRSIKYPGKYFKYFKHDSVIGVIDSKYFEHLTFVLDIARIIACTTFQFVPKTLETQELAFTAVKRNGLMLLCALEECITPELCLAAVQQNGQALEYVPKQIKTPEICLAAIQQNGMVLRLVPKTLKTSELCLAAVQNHGFALKYVPEERKTPEICLAAVQNDEPDDESEPALAFVPEAFKTSALCLVAVKNNDNALRFVPEELKNEIRAAETGQG